MTVSSVSAASSTNGLDFQSLLQIILQQLTYQDPLKPMDNYQFVSQLAEFSQLQQTQSLNASIANLLAAQAAQQATGLLGRTIDFITTGATTTTGTVKSVTFAGGQPLLTVTTAKGETIANVAMANVTQVQ